MPNPQVALKRLGVSPEDLGRLQMLPIDEARKGLDELKAKARKAFRKLALELHPDRTGGDEAKTAEFIILQKVLEELEKLRLEPARPVVPQGVYWQAPMRVIQMSYGWGGPMGTTNSATTASTTIGFGSFVVNMRPTGVR